MRGTYTLLIQLSDDIGLKIGSLGEIDFETGAYAYVGSALKNLNKRVERHLREEKNLHWHIDYLLTEAPINEVLYGEGEERKECDIASVLAEKFPSIEGFGASDCQCKSHLFYSKEISVLRKDVTSSYEKVGLQPRTWENG
ncbi:hypothetical protein AKJ63_01660 [candidate division MSBL1 archaeon SCGC-AAA259D18]|uniref:GIY-YIG domain-containing protein n=2 Tax=candidate division MSBL1 TaxID=215777 RepID=A0A133U789_9EURY|nr:hypothetical protein AKJ57_04505 [candidate division MSBL1 archaeon SCGC-AAA259A05]KXA91298.1 hypothetical protein AKJ63_01660 [candidate division MSBL1 archaeon SCGC-AAA259D18]